jgi:hypothetical protein
VDQQQPEVDDLSDWLDDANRTVFADNEWDDTKEWTVREDAYAGIVWAEPKDRGETLHLSDIYDGDEVEVVADKDGLRSWRQDTGAWRAIT